MKKNSWLNLGTLLVLVTILVAACSTGAPKQTNLMKDFGVEDVTTRELEVIVYGFAVQFAGAVELAAHTIQDSTNSPEVRKNAIMWKVNAVPVIYRAAFGPDPLGSLSSLWAFSIQMMHLFTTGAGQNLFGEWQRVAVEAVQGIEADAQELASSVMPNRDIPQFRSTLVDYAKNHPIDNLLFVRGENSFKFLKEVAGTSGGGLSAAASMSEEMRSLADRMSILTVSIPNQFQWQAELMMAEAPEFIAEQRDSTLVAVEREYWNMLRPLMEFMAKERDLVSDDVSRERAAVLKGIAEERIAVLEALAEERNFAMKQVAEERNATMEQLTTLTLQSIERLIEESSKSSQGAIDHVFWRAFQLLAIPVAGLIVFCIVVLLMIRNGLERYLKILAAEKSHGRSGPGDSV